MRSYFVYILASKTRVLYVGITSDLKVRLWEHKNGTYDSFTKKYQANRLVYFETTTNSLAAIAREKQIKGWRREKKVKLVESSNPDWNDLSEKWKS